MAKSKVMRKPLKILIVGLLYPLSSWAGGFLIYEHGAAATGMAGARTALDGDPSSLYFNPAAITELEGLQLELGTTLILPYIHYHPAGRPENPRTYTSYRDGQYVQLAVNDGENPADATVKLFTPLHLYATYRIEDWGLTAGFGLNNPFGLGTYWPRSWDGRFIAVETEIQTFFSQPTLAVDLARWLRMHQSVRLSLAVGYDLVYGTARLGRQIDLRAAEALSLGQLVAPEGSMRLTADAWAHGWNAALYFQLPQAFALGASLRSGVRMNFAGTGKFFLGHSAQQAADILGLAVPEETTGRVTIDLPWTLNFGAALLAIENLRLAADLYLAFFSSYDRLELKLDCIEDGSCSDTLAPPAMEKNWHTSLQFSLGAEYVLFRNWLVRAGWGMVTSPVPAETYDPSLPDGRRQLLAAGFGWRGGWFACEAGYLVAFWSGEKNNRVGEGDYLNPEGRANGKYSTVSHQLAFSFLARF